MLSTVLLSVFAVPIFIAGVLFLVGKEQLLFLKSELPRMPIRRVERLAIGLSFSFVGMLLLVTAYSIYVVGEPFWFLDKVFGLIT
mgnify:FL=1